MKAESKGYPRYEYSNREAQMFYPHNIQVIQREDMEGKPEGFYSYDLLKFPLTKDKDVNDRMYAGELSKTELEKMVATEL